MNKRIDAYIFDMDGTLVDNFAYHVKAWQAFSKQYGNELSKEQIREWMGAQGGYYLEQIMGHPLPKEEVDRLCLAKEEIYRAMYTPKLPDGLREWLDYAHARNIKLALATGGPKENVDFILDALDLRKDFDVIVDATMYAKSKPDPECFLLAAQMLGVAPEDCRVYEDALNGVRAAKAAGMQCHAVTFTNSFDALAEVGPDKIFDSYQELKIFPVRGPRTAEELQYIARLDELRKCADEPEPSVPLACVVEVTDYEEIHLANERYALITVVGPEEKTWRLCIERGTIAKGELGLFIAKNAAFPDKPPFAQVFKSRVRVYSLGFGVKERVRYPIVMRSIYHNNSGLITPVSDFPTLKDVARGELVAERLHIETAADVIARVANRPVCIPQAAAKKKKRRKKKKSIVRKLITKVRQTLSV